MTSKTFTSGTVVDSPWLNDVNNATYNGIIGAQSINYSDTGIAGTFASTVAGYSQVVIQNKSSATNASTNINVSNNTATPTTNFLEMGINSSTFTGTGSFSQPNNAYVASGSTDLVIGTYTNKAIRFVINSGTTDAAVIDSTGVTIPTLSSTNITTSSMNGGQLAGLRNRIINGNFGINQRAYVSGAAVGTGLYGHDRWKMAASADTYTFSTTANVTTVTIPAGKVLQQVIEGLNLETGTYTLSWSGTAQGKIGAGSYGASGIIGSITGGTNTTIEFGPGTVSKVQLEIGSIATVFEQRPYGLDLQLCQRYLPIYRSTSTLDFLPGSATAFSAVAVSAIIPFQVPPRVAPTGLSAPASGDFTVNAATGGGVSSATTFTSATTNSARISLTSSGMTAGQSVQVYFNSDSSYLAFTGCEL